ncbi:hypothetical protein [Meridianimarinicoccus roseus]|uniref:hypothetical protein n=1 Tax=Meridianimarinicoccus roseus TaxID=2072018 RepID=UPI001EE67F3B|nr:hypothetical protein [Meridianimarinicoccus roseus]
MMPIHVLMMMIGAVVLAAAATVTLVSLVGVPGAALLPATLLASLLLYRRL